MIKETPAERNLRLRTLLKDVLAANEALRESDAAWAATDEYTRRRIEDLEFEVYILRLPGTRLGKLWRRWKTRLTWSLYHSWFWPKKNRKLHIGANASRES